MSLKEQIASTWMEARKSKDRVMSTVLGFWKSEAETMAKNEGVPVSDDHYETAGKRMLKNLNKTLEAQDSTDTRDEIAIVERFMPADPNMTDPLDVIVQRVKDENPGKPANAILGMVMKATQGRFTANDVKEEMGKTKQ